MQKRLALTYLQMHGFKFDVVTRRGKKVISKILPQTVEYRLNMDYGIEYVCYGSNIFPSRPRQICFLKIEAHE